MCGIFAVEMLLISAHGCICVFQWMQTNSGGCRWHLISEASRNRILAHVVFSFQKPVEIGSLLMLSSQVRDFCWYCLFKYHSH